MWKKTISLMVISACMTGNVAAQGIVDVHCHNILPFYLEALEKHDAAMDEGFSSSGMGCRCAFEVHG